MKKLLQIGTDVEIRSKPSPMAQYGLPDTWIQGKIHRILVSPQETFYDVILGDGSIIRARADDVFTDENNH